jgi:hypothetical protein
MILVLGVWTFLRALLGRLAPVAGGGRRRRFDGRPLSRRRPCSLTKLPEPHLYLRLQSPNPRVRSTLGGHLSQLGHEMLLPVGIERTRRADGDADDRALRAPVRQIGLAEPGG